jgi:signal transduction histidine kinase
VRFERVISLFYPKSLKLHDEKEVRDAYTFILSSILGAVIFFVYGINYLVILDSLYFLKSNTTWTLLLLLNILLFKKYGNLPIAANVTAAIVYIGILNASLCLGREKTMGIYFINIIPLAVGLFLSRRYLAFWSVMCILAYPFLKYLGPLYFTHLEIPLTAEFEAFLWESSYYVNMVLIITFILIYMIALKNSLSSLENKSDTAHGLLRVLTHDIKNPLTVVYNSALLLQKKDLSKDDIQKWAKKIEFGGKMINNITDQIKQIEALESGKSRLELRSVNLDHILNNVQQLFQEKLASKNLVLSQEGDFDLDIVAEPTTLTHQVLANIVSNAIKFSQDKGHIVIRCSKESSNIMIQIEDNGIGIPPEILKNIFSKSAPTTRQGTSGEKGTGFGMPLVKEYMQLYNGNVDVQSTDISDSPNDHGTKITLTFKSAA